MPGANLPVWYSCCLHKAGFVSLLAAEPVSCNGQIWNQRFPGKWNRVTLNRDLANYLNVPYLHHEFLMCSISDKNSVFLSLMNKNVRQFNCGQQEAVLPCITNGKKCEYMI